MNGWRQQWNKVIIISSVTHNPCHLKSCIHHIIRCRHLFLRWEHNSCQLLTLKLHQGISLVKEFYIAYCAHVCTINSITYIYNFSTLQKSLLNTVSYKLNSTLKIHQVIYTSYKYSSDDGSYHPWYTCNTAIIIHQSWPTLL